MLHKKKIKIKFYLHVSNSFVIHYTFTSKHAELKTYHDVAYRTNTLAAFPIAVLASLEMLTFSGSWNDREEFVNYMLFR